MADTAQLENQIAQAWAQHRQGNHDAAVKAFSQVVSTAPDNIDALFGLGLAQRANHQTDAALETFERCRALIAAQLEANPGEDRYEMLTRMINQRLAELRARAGH